MKGVRFIQGGILLILIPIFIWLVYDRITLYMDSVLHDAVTTSCKGKWVKVQTSIRNNIHFNTRKQVQYAPVAISKNGLKGVGNFWFSQSLCQRMVGLNTKILINKKDTQQGTIYSFINFWFLPLLLLVFIILFLVFERAKLFNRLLFIAFISVSGYFITKELDYLPLAIKQLSNDSDTLPVEPIQKCIKAALLKEGVTNSKEIISVSCSEANITDLSAFSSLVNLEKLTIQDNHLESLETMPLFLKLKELHLSGTKSLISLKGIENAPNLEYLTANKCSIENISNLAALTKLRKLELLMNNISDISSLSELTMLEEIILNHNSISSIEALSKKRYLKKLQLHSNNISSISPLFNNKAMMVFGISGRGNISCKEIARIKAELSIEAKVYGPKNCQ